MWLLMVGSLLGFIIASVIKSPQNAIALAGLATLILISVLVSLHPTKVGYTKLIIITKNLYCATKCRCKLSSARFSATVKLGMKQMCLQHTLANQQRD